LNITQRHDSFNSLYSLRYCLCSFKKNLSLTGVHSAMVDFGSPMGDSGSDFAISPETGLSAASKDGKKVKTLPWTERCYLRLDTN
jgi:hypothetical protein